MEFNASKNPWEFILIQIFQDRLKPLITAQIEQYGWENKTWEELIEKTIEAKAKISFLPFSFVCDMDKHYLQNNHSASLTKFRLFLLRSLEMDLLKKLKTQNSHIFCI